MGGASIWWSDIRRMLDICASGWTEELKQHHRWIRFGGRTWNAFPKGSGTGGRDYEVHGWQVRRMLKHLAIDIDCARRQVGGL